MRGPELLTGSATIIKAHTLRGISLVPVLQDPFYANVPWLAGMDWLIRFWWYFDSRLSGIRYIIAGCSFYGGDA